MEVKSIKLEMCGGNCISREKDGKVKIKELRRIMQMKVEKKKKKRTSKKKTKSY